MAQSNKLSQYELERQERMKENQKMLEELFPDGTDIVPPKGRRAPKRRRVTADANSLGTGSGSEASNSGEEGGSPGKPKRSFRTR